MQGFTALSHKLNRLMREEHVAVHQTRNPVIGMLRHGGGRESLTHVMRQYAIFPRELISFMEAAREKALAAGWGEVAAELETNIAEELGHGTDGVPHHRILTEGLTLALGVPVDETMPSNATAGMLAEMRAIFDHEPGFVLGATYAVETTSIPELTIVLRVIESLLAENVPAPLRRFFDMHLNVWEPAHEEGLRSTVARCLTAEEHESFEAGFRAALRAMDRWWQGLAIEALAHGQVRGVPRTLQ